MIKKTTSFDEETGEIIKETKTRFNIFDPDKGYLFKSNSHQKRMYNNIKLSEVVMNTQDFARVHFLAENIYKDTNTIMIRANPKVIRVANIDDISIMIRLSPKRTIDFVKRMIKAHIVAKRVDKIGELVMTKYLINPLFFNSQKRISPDLYFLFKESLNCYLPEWVIAKYHEIGNLRRENPITEIRDD